MGIREIQKERERERRRKQKRTRIGEDVKRVVRIGAGW